MKKWMLLLPLVGLIAVTTWNWSHLAAEDEPSVVSDVDQASEKIGLVARIEELERRGRELQRSNSPVRQVDSRVSPEPQIIDRFEPTQLPAGDDLSEDEPEDKKINGTRYRVFLLGNGQKKSKTQFH